LPSVAEARRLGGARRAIQAARTLVSEIDAEAARERAALPGYDRGPMVAFLVGALCLVGMEYLAGPRVLAGLLRGLHELFPEQVAAYPLLRTGRWYALLDLGFWVATRTLGFLLVPGLAIRLLLGQRLSDYGLRVAGLKGHLPIYGCLFLAVLPLLGAAALRPEFVAYYPFYRHAADSWFDLLCWEALYAFQFFCVEFFFRGFLPMASRKSLGSHAAAAAMVPYCMVHFTKPLLEVLGAIPAGLTLGLLALRTRSIWGGVLLHVAVAWTMDALAIAQTTGFPRTFWPLGE
jgi:membrane protease YdiL (CAAX protease family)